MSTPATTIQGSVRDVNNRFMTAVKEKDTRPIAQLYTRDGQLLPPGGDVMTGQDEIEQFWGEAIRNVGEITFKTKELDAFGDTAVEIGRYDMTGDDGKPIDEGKYIVVWNTSRPPHGN